MKRRLLIITLIFAVVVVPFMAFAAEDQSKQPQLEVLTLDKCMELANQNSQSIKQANLNVEKANAAVHAAEGGFWPALNYQLGYTKLSDPQDLGWNPTGPVTNGAPYTGGWVDVQGPDYGYAGSISLTQPLYTGGKLTDALKLAKLQLAMVKEDQRKAKQNLTLNVKSDYYQVWLTEQKLKVAQSSYDNMEKHYQQVQNFYKVGTSSKFDLLQAEVKWKALKPPIIQAENDEAIAKLNLAILLGIDKDRQFTVNSDLDQLQLPEEVVLQYQDVMKQAYQNRPEIRQSQDTIELSKINLHLVQAGYKPVLALTGQYKTAGTDISMDQSKTWSLTLGVSGMLFDGFTTKAKVDSAKDDVQLASSKDSSQRDTIRSDVEQAIQGLKATLETTRYNQANIDLNKESLRLTQARFAAGMSTTLDVSDAETNLDQALNGYYLGMTNYLTALAKLDMVLGKDN
jgi:outer membrane protein